MEAGPIVRLYESRLWRRNPLLALLMGLGFEAEYRIVSAALRLPGDALVLDLACGTGIYARRLAVEASAGRVIGLDLSRPMLRRARDLLRSEGLENLELVQGDARMLPFADARFDAVNCSGALHLLGSPSHALAEMARVLGPGGRLTIATYRSRATRLSQRIAGLRERVLGLGAFRSDRLDGELRGAGFEQVRCHHARGIWLIMSATRARAPS